MKRIISRVMFQSKRNYLRKHMSVYQTKLHGKKEKLLNFSSFEPKNHFINQVINDNTQNISGSQIDIVSDSLQDFITKFCESDELTQKLLFYGTEKEEMTKTDYNCPSCGSNLQCSSKFKPGFIPYEVYSENSSNRLAMKDLMCIRCFFLENQIDPLDISFETEYYTNILWKQMMNFESLTILLIADLADLPNSICLPENFFSLLEKAEKKIKIILLGNKVDLFDCNNKYVENYLINRLLESARLCGIDTDRFVTYTQLISAKHTDGLNGVIDELMMNRLNRGQPVFLVGTANVGKSTVFNQLIKSDLCKSIARNKIREALISKVPGTTLNLLKFPIVNVNSSILKRREDAKRIFLRKNLNQSIENKAPLDVSSIIDMPHSLRFEVAEELATYYSSSTWGIQGANEASEQQILEKYDTYDEKKITSNLWCFDTPGFINPYQIINYLDLGQLEKMKFLKLKIPRIFLLKEGMSVLISNIGRLDIVESDSPVYLAVHSVVPVHLMDTKDVDEYMELLEADPKTRSHLFQYRSNLPPALLNQIHQCDSSFGTDNLRLVPQLQPTEFKVDLKGSRTAAGDIVFSSLGWICISGENYGQEPVLFKGWLPAGILPFYRKLSMVPEVISRRDKRIGRTQEFRIHKPNIYSEKQLSQFYPNL